MLALVSTNTTIRRGAPEEGSGTTASLRNGRAKPSAIRHKARQRSASKSKCSSRLLRVSRGGDDKRNIRELNCFRSRVVRRIKWKRTGNATAKAPIRKSGARKLIFCGPGFRGLDGGRSA